MSVVGLITEYNPFHSGHEYHIKKARELTGAETALVIMSGNYVQRGTPAFMDKHTRTGIALRHGADIILELPVPFSCASAELFALAAVTLLHKTGIVDYICFGCECDNLELLDKIADILAEAKKNHSHKLNCYIKEYIKNGDSYAAARSRALCDYLTTDSYAATSKICNEACDSSLLCSILAQPNNILAIEYLKALKLIGSDIKPVPLKRTAASYHDMDGNDFMFSSSSVRNIISNSSHLNYTEYMEKLSAFDKTYNKELGTVYPVLECDFNTILGEKLISCKVKNEDLSAFAGIDTTLANRIFNIMGSSSFSDWNTFAELIKTKNIAYTAVSRALLSITLGLKKQHMEQYINNDIASYVRLLGFKSDASACLKQIKKNGTLTIVGQLSETKDNSALSGTDRLMLEQSVYYDELYNMVIRTKYGSSIPNEYQRKLIID